MTAAGDQSLAVAYAQVGATESPPYSNLCSPYTDAWGAGAWCAMFVSWCYNAAGHPLPPIDGPAGFSYVPNGQVAAYTTGHAVGEGGVEPGDTLIFSWEEWHMEGGIALCSYGAYAGTPAGDHTGFFAGWLGGGYMATVEGNTGSQSWDDGGAVLNRNDRHVSQICCYARHAALGAGGGGGPIVVTTYRLEDDRIDLVAVNREGHIYHKWYEGLAWQPGVVGDLGGWEHITPSMDNDGLATDTPTCSWFGEQFQVFWPRRDGQVGHAFIGPGTGGWAYEVLNAGVTGVGSTIRSKLIQTS